MTRKRKPTEPPAEGELKERVIHTRVPESLEAELRKRSQKLGVSVSNLVRNVLGHAFGLVGDVVADGHAIARAARGEGTTPEATVDDVLAWQQMKLAKNAVCASCNEILPRGTVVALGIADHGGARVIVCLDCEKELTA